MEPVLHDVEAWLRQGAELRAKLSIERHELVSRLSEIDTALSALPPETGAASPPTPARSNGAGKVLPGVAKNASAPEIVRAILRSAPTHGLGSSDVIHTARMFRPAIKVVLIHSALSRLVKAEEIEGIGPKGSRRYRSRQTKEAAPTDSKV